MPQPEIRIVRNPKPDAAQVAAWRALWRILLEPRPPATFSDRCRVE